MASALECSLKKCIQGALTQEQAHVEVKTFDSNASKDERKSMEVAWHEDGEAMFHDICWKALIDSVKNDNPFTLSPMEKEMMKEARRTAEYFDSYKKIQREAARIAQMLKSANHAVVFTGAGISTSAGIGDFRGKAGKWTEKDREKSYGVSKWKRSRNFCYESLRPSYTHEAIVKLMNMGHIKFMISQNTDCLHRLSGVPRDKIAELHGNSFHEKCEKCGARYERPFSVARASKNQVHPRICVHCHFNHRTGRLCERKGCEGYLINTIINFGDSLEKRVLSTADEQARRNDLMICLGSTLRVTPACDLVEMGIEPRRIAIINRQPTSFDHLCYVTPPNQKEGQLGSRLFANCDQIMQEIMKHFLPPEELREWEDAREQRFEQYAKEREPPT